MSDKSHMVAPRCFERQRDKSINQNSGYFSILKPSGLKKEDPLQNKSEPSQCKKASSAQATGSVQGHLLVVATVTQCCILFFRLPWSAFTNQASPSLLIEERNLIARFNLTESKQQPLNTNTLAIFHIIPLRFLFLFETLGAV